MKKVLTIIVSYNFEPWIDKCLGSLQASHYPTDVVVVDNASADATVATVRQRYPDVQVIENGYNAGFGQANNKGLELAIKEHYDYAFLLNQDAWIEPDTIGTLVEVADRHPDYGIVSPVHLNGSVRDGSKQIWRGFTAYTGLKSLDQQGLGELVEVPFINAAVWLLPVEAIRTRVGGFDPLFFHYGEDKDLSNRMHYHHLKVGYTPLAVAYHDCDRPTDEKKRMRLEELYHLTEYANVNHSWPHAFAYGPLAVVKKMLTGGGNALSSSKLSSMKSYGAMLWRLLGKTGQVNAARRRNKRTPRL